MPTNTKQIWTLGLQDDLFALTHPEDGSEYTASVFFVVATNEVTGERYAHDHRFYSAHTYAETDEDGYYCGIASHKELTVAQAEAFLAKVQAAQAAGRFTTPVDRNHWVETYPVYGSPAYIQSEPEQVAAEKAADLRLPFDLF